MVNMHSQRETWPTLTRLPSSSSFSKHTQHAQSANTLQTWLGLIKLLVLLPSANAQSACTVSLQRKLQMAHMGSMHSMMWGATFYNRCRLHNVVNSPDQGQCQQAPVRGGKQLLRNSPVGSITGCACTHTWYRV